jgi:cytoskeletal protein CcmA (bactofilin family)
MFLNYVHEQIKKGSSPMFHRQKVSEQKTEKQVVKPVTENVIEDEKATGIEVNTSVDIEQEEIVSEAVVEEKVTAAEKMEVPAELVQAGGIAPAANVNTETTDTTPQVEEEPQMDNNQNQVVHETMQQTQEHVAPVQESVQAAPAQGFVQNRAFSPAPAAAHSQYQVAPQGQTSTAVSERKLVIGAGITMSGEIEACDHLIVEGTVEAALKGSSVLDIEETGTFYGSVEIEEATIAGRFEGDIQVSGRLTIKSSGAVTGTISYKELEIEAGAVIDGKISPLGNMSQMVKEEPKVKKAVRSNDNMGAELPFASKASMVAAE